MLPIKALRSARAARQVFLLSCVLALGAGAAAQVNVNVGTLPLGVGVNPMTNKIYVANASSNTVSVIDGLTNTTTSLTTPGTPLSIAVNPLTNKIYLVNSNARSIQVIDGATNAMIRVAAGTTVTAVAVNVVTNKIYVVNRGDNTVTVVDGVTNSTSTVAVGANPYGLAVNPVTNKIYVANQDDQSVTIIDGATNTTTSVAVGTQPIALAINAVTNKVYVANFGSKNVTVINGGDNSTATIAAGTAPNKVAVNPVTNRIYVSDVTDSNVRVFDGATNGLLAAVATGAHPVAMGVNAITNKIYIANANGNTVTIIDGATNVGSTSRTVSNPTSLAINPVTNKIYVTSRLGNYVAVIDGTVNSTTTLTTGASPRMAALNPATNTLYVANGSGNTVSVIDGTTNAVLATPAVGAGPTWIAVNPVTTRIYVANNTDNSVSVIDGTTNAAVATVPVGASPYAVDVDPLTNKIYTANYGSNTVSVLDGATNTVVATVATGRNPYALVVNPVTNTIYASNAGDSTVTVIDGATNSTKTVTTGGGGGFTLALNIVTNKIYVPSRSAGNVTVIDGATNTNVATITVGTGPQLIAVNSITNKIYVANINSNSVSVIDGATNAVISTIPIGTGPFGMGLNPITNQVYVANQVSNNLNIIDGSSNTVTATLPTGNLPGNVLVNPGTNMVYVVVPNSNNLTVINVDKHQTVPLSTVITGVPNGLPLSSVFQTYSATLGFNANVTSGYSDTSVYGLLGVTNPPPTELYVEVDGAAPASAATPVTASGANPATFDITLPPQQPGLHTLYVYPTYGLESGQGSSDNNGNSSSAMSPEIGSLTSYVFLVIPTPTTTTVISDVNPQLNGTSVTFTATVMPIVVGSPGPAGSVSFYDGSTLLGTGAVSQTGGAYVATFQTSSLTTAGPHAITANYSGDNTYSASAGNMTETIIGPPAAIVAIGGGAQTTIYGTPFAQPLVVKVTDSLGTPVPQASVSFSGTGLQFLPVTMTTGATGSAQTMVDAGAVGSYTAYASVSGVSPPATFALTVTKAQLTVKANDTTRPFGQANPTFTATITGFVNGDTDLAVTGVASLSSTATAQSPIGSYPITATQGSLAAANYAFSFASGVLAVTLPSSSSTTLAISPATVMYGDPALFTAVVAPGGATGTNRFYENSSDLVGTASLDGASTAVLPVDTLPVGTHNITALYQGDLNVPASTSNTAQFTVTPRSSPGGGAALTIVVNDATRTATDVNPAFTYSAAGQLVNGDTYATAISGTPVYTTTAGTTPGTFAISVNGLSSANYTLAFVPGTLTVVESPTTTTISATSDSTQYGDPVTLTATVSPAVASGAIGFFDGALYLGSATVSAGVASLSTTAFNAGTHTITATYNGDGTYASSTSGPATVVVVKRQNPDGTPVLTVTVQNASRVFNASDPEFSYVVTGELVNGDSYASAVFGAPVYLVADTPASPAGSTFSISVNGVGSQNYELAFVPGTLTIAAAPTSTALAADTLSAQYGDSVTLTATVAPAGVTGSVVFSEGTNVLGAGTVAGGIATVTTTSLSARAHTVTATYLGDNNYGASTSSPVTIAVTQRAGPDGGATLTVTVNNVTRAFGQGNPAFSYTVTGPLLNSDSYTNAVSGIPVYTSPRKVNSPAGMYPITIAGGLSSTNYVLAFVPGTLTVTKSHLQVVTLSSSANPSVFGTPVTFTATVASDAGGTIAFVDGTATLGTGTITDGTATFTTSTLAQGMHPITAVYGGDADFTGGSSAVLNQVVTAPAVTADFTIGSNTSAQLIPPGSSAAYSIAINPIAGPFTNAVALTATGLPAGATYAFTPASVTPGSGGTTSALNITVPAQNAGRVFRNTLAPVALAILGLPFVWTRRRRCGNSAGRALWILLAFATLGAFVGCGTGGYFSQPEQTYTITVTGTSGSLSHNTTVTLTVQ